jgi:hypothetical protein
VGPRFGLARTIVFLDVNHRPVFETDFRRPDSVCDLNMFHLREDNEDKVQKLDSCNIFIEF